MLFHIFPWPCDRPLTWDGQTAQRWLQKRLPRSPFLSACFVHTGAGSRIDVVLANRIAKYSLRDVGLVGDTGIPTHVPVAAVFQLAE